MRFSPKGAQCNLLNASKKSKKSNKGFGSNKKTRNFSPNAKTARIQFSVPIFGVKELRYAKFDESDLKDPSFDFLKIQSDFN